MTSPPFGISAHRGTGPGAVSRRTVILGGGSLAAAGSSLGGRRARAAEGTPVSASTLAHTGVTYDIGTNWFPGYQSRQRWTDEMMRQEIEVISRDLHCTSISLFGSDVERLATTLGFALDAGLRVWAQPRLIDATSEDTVTHLVEVSRHLERARVEGGDVTLNVGCELSLFMDGIFPGASLEERVGGLVAAAEAGDLSAMYAGLNEHLGEAVRSARSVFDGHITYGSGPWEAPGIDWSVFDIVGVDAYRNAENASRYVEELRSYRRFGKPVVVTEFGCCCYEGAADAGGTGYDIVDWDKPVPELNGTYVRDEREQADYLLELLDVFEAERLHGAFAYTFLEENAFSPDPRFDLDMASFGIVTFFPEDGAPVEGTDYWKPKIAFHELAARFGHDQATPAP